MKFFILPFLFLAQCLLAQDSLLYSSLVPRHALKISPFHLFGFYPTIQVAYEMKVARRFTLQLEGGYVVRYQNNDTEYQDKRGVKGKLELHYYMLPSARARLIYYGAAEIYWNAVNFDRVTSQQECFDLECNHVYMREYKYKVMYREPGIALKAGFVKYFGYFFMDINSGWGIRFVDYTDPSFGEGITNEVNGWGMISIPNEDDRIALSPIFGIRFGYLLH